MVRKMASHNIYTHTYTYTYVMHSAELTGNYSTMTLGKWQVDGADSGDMLGGSFQKMQCLQRTVNNLRVPTALYKWTNYKITNYISKFGKHCQKMIPFLGFLDYKGNRRLNNTLFCQLAHRASCGQVQLARPTVYLPRAIGQPRISTPAI